MCLCGGLIAYSFVKWAVLLCLGLEWGRPDGERCACSMDAVVMLYVEVRVGLDLAVSQGTGWLVWFLFECLEKESWVGFGR